MRRLTLLRHAHAADAPLGGEDFDRPLSARGRKAAQELGERLGALLPPPDRLCVSPARRTRETAELACGPPWPAAQREKVPTLYHATLDVLLREIASTPPDCSHLMLVGHNPGLSELWSLLGGETGFGGLAPCEWRSRTFDAAWVRFAR